jgi:dCMP deaminase
MCGETNNDVSYSVNADNSKYVDSLKYRNEIEVMSRLRNYKVSDLYNESTNADVSNKINELYPSQDLYVYNDNPIVNDIMSNPISWDTYFMNMALLASLRSKDENTKVGSVLVLNNKVVGMGYNGLPSHLDESKFPTSRDASLQYNATKYAYVVHAELNSILNTTVYDLNGSKIYCTLFPCNECAKVIIQKGISEVIYLSDKYHDEPHYVASRKLLDEAGINYRQYTGKLLVNM